jgi:hypothetical protein
VAAPGHQSKTRARTLRVRATLAYTVPPIERRLDLASDLRLDQLHRILQASFEWHDSHLHEFTKGEQRWDDGSAASFEPSPFEDGPPPEPEHKTRLDQVLIDVGDQLEYTYDFGDSWLHVLTVEEVIPREQGDPLARLVSAERAAPPEDCGGVPGYEELLNALADPGAPEHAELLEWATEVFVSRCSLVWSFSQIHKLRSALPPLRTVRRRATNARTCLISVCASGGSVSEPVGSRRGAAPGVRVVALLLRVGALGERVDNGY